jgi:hypothetical protein
VEDLGVEERAENALLAHAADGVLASGVGIHAIDVNPLCADGTSQGHGQISHTIGPEQAEARLVDVRAAGLGMELNCIDPRVGLVLIRDDLTPACERGPGGDLIVVVVPLSHGGGTFFFVFFGVCLLAIRGAIRLELALGAAQRGLFLTTARTTFHV